MFPYNWSLKDGYPAQGITKHGKTVFTTFACGGGSSMGYKLAGYEVIGANDIDPQMEKVYKQNHHPRLFYKCPIKDMINMDIPEELKDLDILDGSPPCSTFSMSGSREEAWGKNKMFREGQAVQVLDDLFFDFIALAKRLQPKIVIAENVKGMLQGNAKGYVIEIKKQFEEAGYSIQVFLLNAATMGVPQKRERVFFLCSRKDLKLPKLSISFNERSIPFGDIKKVSLVSNLQPKQKRFWDKRKYFDKGIGDIAKRVEGKDKYFSHTFAKERRVLSTITAANDRQMCLYSEPRYLTKDELIAGGSFPTDYNFVGLRPGYLIGMSVPPIMMAQVSYQVYLQWLQLPQTNPNEQS